jgi:hypothetical protein
MEMWLKEFCELTGVPTPIKGKPHNHGGNGDGSLKAAEDHVTLLEATTSARQKGVVEHGGHMQCTQVMRDQKYKSHMLDPSRVVENRRIKKPKNPVILYGMHSEIIPREGTMLEFKTRGLFDLSVTWNRFSQFKSLLAWQ